MMSVNDDLLARYLSGACTPRERARIARWLGESLDGPALAAHLREIATETRTLTPERRAAMLAAIKHRSLEGSVPRGSAMRSRRWSPVFRIAAAAACIAAIIGGGLALRVQRSPSPFTPLAGLRTYATAPGQRLALRLPDGTAVTLAPASLLRLSADYGAGNRTVELEGEAAFAVRHDAARPFTVRTPRGTTHDIGTYFVVRAYPDDQVTDVVVAEGSVSFLPEAASRRDSVVLTPHERLRLARNGRVTMRRGVALEPYFAWTTGRLVFRDTPLDEAAARISRWYDLDVRVATPAIGAQLLTATFDDSTVVDVLPLIATSLKLGLTQSGRTYTFVAR